MKANLAQKEPAILKEWESTDVYGQIRKQSKGKKKFILHDGPPYANGRIHIGHTLNKVLKDIVVRFKTMSGFDSPYVPGWDCHGLPIEHRLLKEMKKHKSQVDRVEFRKKAHDYAMQYVGIQREEFKRLGIFGDWDHPYLTLTHEYEYWILKSLAELNKKGYIYRGLKPVNWCFDCETALAEAEVEYEDHTSPSVYVKFKVNNPQVIEGLPKKDLSLMIWTTTPWTLIANVAVAVHNDFEYSFVETGQDIIILESSLVAPVLEKGGIKDFKIIKKAKGKDLVACMYSHPLGSKENCRVVAVDYVTKEEGTGLVHTAPGHGQEDYLAGQKFGLDVVMPVNDKGVFDDSAGEFAGQHVFKANPKIIERLQNEKTLFFSDQLSHSYPHCWRCKKPIIFRATEQWFLKVDHEGLREKLVKIIKESVQWIPPAGRERILGMISGRPDWCLSRQRYWGVPIPAIRCKGSQNSPKLFTEVIEHFAKVARKEGTDAWFTKDVSELIPKDFTCPGSGKKEFEKTYDILDVWFDSGVSHQAVLRGQMKEDLPCAMYLEGSDQHRGWFQSSLIPAVCMEGRAPYKSVLTHGFTVDGQGRKMSKSLGNVIAPQEVMKTSGADILRLWVALSNYHDDIRLSKEIIARLVDAYRKIRNTLRFMLSNLYDYHKKDNKLNLQSLEDIDRWALSKTAALIDRVTQYYQSYDFDKATKAIYDFCNSELSSIYLDILKDRLYTSPANSPRRRAAQNVLYEITQVLVRLLAPVLVFTTEEVFRILSGLKDGLKDKSVHLTSWPDEKSCWRSADVEKKLAIPLALREAVLKCLEEARAQGVIGSSLDAKIVIETASERDGKALEAVSEDMRYLLIVSQVDIKKVAQIDKGLNETFSETKIIVEKAQGKKCARCWNYSIRVGKDEHHPDLCERCLPVVKEIIHAKESNEG